MTKAATPTDTPWKRIPLAQIAPSGTNPRKHFDQGQLEELANSMKVKGVLQPILVRPVKGVEHTFSIAPINDAAQLFTVWPPAYPTATERHVVGSKAAKALAELLSGDHYELVDGERRFRAAALAGLDEIPSIVRELSDLEALQIQVIANEQRQDLHPLEKAEGYQALVKQGMSIEDLAAAVDKSASSIRSLLKLLVLPEKARAAVETGKLPMSTAELIARVPNPQLRESCTGEVLAGNQSGFYRRNEPAKDEPMSYRQTKDHIAARYMLELKQAPFPQKDAELVPSAGACTTCPKKAGNNREEYPDARADTCCDPVCYKSKVEAWQQRALKDAETKGQKLLPADVAKKLFAYDGNLYRDLPYFDLAAQCPGDHKGKTPRSYKQLLDGQLDAEIVLVLDPKGQLHRLVPKDKAMPILSKEHGLFKQAASSGSTYRIAQDKREAEKRRAEQALRKDIEWGLLCAVVAAAKTVFKDVPADNRRVNQVLRVLVQEAGAKAWGEWRELIARRRGFKVATAAAAGDALKSEAESLTGPDLIALLIEYAAAEVFTTWNAAERGKELAEALGIDRKKIEKEIKDRKAAERSPSKNGKAASKKKAGARK